jgi:hypothetical protein
VPVDCRVQGCPVKARVRPVVTRDKPVRPAVQRLRRRRRPARPVQAAVKKAFLPAPARRVVAVPRRAGSARQRVTGRPQRRAARKGAAPASPRDSKADKREASKVASPAVKVERVPLVRSRRLRVAVRSAQQAVLPVRVETLRNPDPASPVAKVARAATPRRGVPVGSAATAVPQAQQGPQAAGRPALRAVLLAVPHRAPAALAAAR